MRKATLLLALTLITYLANAQSFDIGYNTGRSVYIGDYTLQDFDPQYADQSKFSSYGLRFTYGNFISFGVHKYKNRIMGTTDNMSTANGDKFPNTNFTTDFNGLEVSMEFNILKFDPVAEGFAFTPYLGLGLNMYSYKPMTDVNGDMLPIYDSNNNSLTHEVTTGFSTPYFIGIKSELYRNLYMDFSLGLEITTSDHLDGFAYGNSVDNITSAQLGIYYRIPKLFGTKSKVICPTVN